MNSDSAALDPSRSPASRRRGLALVAVSALLVTTGAACGTDSGGDDPSASDPTTSTPPSESASPSETATGSASASASASPSDSGDPVPSPVIDEAVKGALEDDFPALVPAGVPAGWTVGSAKYAPADGGLWRIDLTDPSGAPVQLVQARAGVKALLQQYLGQAEAAGEVDLGEYGTGVWAVYTADAGTGIVRKLSGTGALVLGPDQDTVVDLAGQLLTAEDSGSGSGDG